MTNYCNFSETGAYNAYDKSNNIIFAVKDAKLYVSVVTLSVRDNQNLSKFLSKRFERSIYWNEYKTKRENNNTIKWTNIFLSQILLKLIDYLF